MYSMLTITFLIFLYVAYLSLKNGEQLYKLTKFSGVCLIAAMAVGVVGFIVGANDWRKPIVALVVLAVVPQIAYVAVCTVYWLWKQKALLRFLTPVFAIASSWGVALLVISTMIDAQEYGAWQENPARCLGLTLSGAAMAVIVSTWAIQRYWWPQPKRTRT